MPIGPGGKQTLPAHLAEAGWREPVNRQTPQGVEHLQLPRAMNKGLASFNLLQLKSGKSYSWSRRYFVLANPQTLPESIKPQYSLRPVLGLSHELPQFVRTGSRTIEVELWHSIYIALQLGRLERGLDLDKKGRATDVATAPPAKPEDDSVPQKMLKRYRNLYQSMTVPLAPGLAPPLIKFDWPSADLNFQGVVTSLDVTYERFRWDGIPIEYTVKLELTEDPKGFMTTRGVQQWGFGFSNDPDAKIR